MIEVKCLYCDDVGGLVATHRHLVEEHLEMVRSRIPLRRVGNPTEVGNMVAVLLSDRLAPYTTGESVTVDGGLHLCPLSSFSDEELLALRTYP